MQCSSIIQSVEERDAIDEYIYIYMCVRARARSRAVLSIQVVIFKIRPKHEGFRLQFFWNDCFNIIALVDW
jgi:hypothetical protein